MRGWIWKSSSRWRGYRAPCRCGAWRGYPHPQPSLGFIRSLQGLRGQWRAASFDRAPTRCHARPYLPLFSPLRHPGLLLLCYRWGTETRWDLGSWTHCFPSKPGSATGTSRLLSPHHRCLKPCSASGPLGRLSRLLPESDFDQWPGLVSPWEMRTVTLLAQLHADRKLSRTSAPPPPWHPPSGVSAGRVGAP